MSHRKLPCVDPPPADPRARRTYWADLPNHGPLVGIRGGWGLHLCDTDAIMDAFDDPDTFVHGVREASLDRDSVKHEKHRRLLRPLFSHLGPRIPELREVARQLIESVEPKGICEIKALGTEYASAALWTVLGWTPEHRTLLTATWTNPSLSLFSAANDKVPPAIAACAQRLRELTNDEIGTEDAEHLVPVIANAGIKTTAAAITFGLLELARQPQLRDRLRDHPENIPAFCHEILRLDPSVPSLIRTVSRDVVVAGWQLRAGQQIRMPVASLNTRDSTDILTGTSKSCPHKHFSFGHGAHRCLAAELGRLEFELFITEWFNTIPPDFTLSLPYREPPPQRGPLRDKPNGDPGPVHLRWTPS